MLVLSASAARLSHADVLHLADLDLSCLGATSSGDDRLQTIRLSGGHDGPFLHVALHVRHRRNKNSLARSGPRSAALRRRRTVPI